MQTKTKPKRPLTERQRAIHARNKTMGPALIVHPLRLIADHSITIGKDEKGQPVKFIGWEYKRARIAADRGNGAKVREMAHSLARAA